MNLAGIKRIDSITLPYFSRLSWVSRAARNLWEPRFHRLASCSIDLALGGLRSAAWSRVFFRVMPDRVFDFRMTVYRDGAVSKRLQQPDTAGALSWNVPSRYRGVRLAPEMHLVERPQDASEIGRADSEIPNCCSNFQQTDTGHWQHSWWPLACATAQPAQTPPALKIEVRGPLAGVPLLHALGLPCLWYCPCSFECPSALEDQRRLAATMQGISLSEELDWLRNIEEWPYEWSALHGIAEIKTPFLKLATNTDPTAEKLVIFKNGNVQETKLAAQGIHFPFLPPGRKGPLVQISDPT